MVLFWSGFDQELALQLDLGWELHHLTCLPLLPLGSLQQEKKNLKKATKPSHI